MLTPHDDAAVEVTGLGDADRDGITVQLPDVTNFAPEGRIDGTAPGSTLNVRALSGGHVIGTMRLQNTADGYAVSASFTGDGNEGTYHVNLFREGALVGTISGIENGDTVLLPRRMPIWLWLWLYWDWPIFWNVASGDLSGSCVWSHPLVGEDLIRVMSDDGTLVDADRYELHEDVRGGGSYPYLAFDRIDYTIGNGRMLLTGESIANRPEE